MSLYLGTTKISAVRTASSSPTVDITPPTFSSGILDWLSFTVIYNQYQLGGTKTFRYPNENMTFEEFLGTTIGQDSGFTIDTIEDYQSDQNGQLGICVGRSTYNVWLKDPDSNRYVSPQDVITNGKQYPTYEWVP